LALVEKEEEEEEEEEVVIVEGKKKQTPKDLPPPRKWLVLIETPKTRPELMSNLLVSFVKKIQR
jgi:hypothetical protein